MSSLISKNSFELKTFELDLNMQKAMQGTMLKKLVENDKKTTLKIVFYLVSRFNDALNLNNKLSDHQTLDIASDLIEFFTYETLEDVVLMFKMIRQGKIGGKIFRLDTQVIFGEWIPQYLEKKAEFRENNHKKKGFNLVSKENLSKEVLQSVSKIRKQLIISSKEK